MKEELVRYTACLGEDNSDLQKALELMLSVPHRAQDEKFTSSIEGYRGSIYKLGRLLAHDWFSVTFGDITKERYLFLFKGKILICKVRRISEDRSVFQLKDIVQLNRVAVKDHPQEERIFELIDEIGNTSLILAAHRDHITEYWLKEIKEFAKEYEESDDSEEDDFVLASASTEPTQSQQPDQTEPEVKRTTEEFKNELEKKLQASNKDLPNKAKETLPPPHNKELNQTPEIAIQDKEVTHLAQNKKEQLEENSVEELPKFEQLEDRVTPQAPQNQQKENEVLPITANTKKTEQPAVTFEKACSKVNLVENSEQEKRKPVSEEIEQSVILVEVNHKTEPTEKNKEQFKQLLQISSVDEVFLSEPNPVESLVQTGDKLEPKELVTQVLRSDNQVHASTVDDSAEPLLVLNTVETDNSAEVNVETADDMSRRYTSSSARAG